MRAAHFFLLLPVLCLAASFSPFAEPAVLDVPANSTEKEIQGALDRVATGGEVHLAAGTFLIHQPILLQGEHQTLRGSGLTTILKLADGADCPVVILGAPLSVLPRSPGHLRVADLLIDGNQSHQPLETWKFAPDGSQINNSGVTAWDVTDAVVERVTCRQCRSGGLVSAHGTRRLTVRDFIAFENHFDGLACYQTEDSLFTGLFLHDNPSAGISLDLAFNHNVISNAMLVGNDLGVFMRDSHGNNFQALDVRHSRSHGIFMAQAGGQKGGVWRLMPGTQCTGNIFAGLIISDSGGKAFLVNNDTCTNNSITGARFQDNSQGGLVQAVPNLVSFQVSP
ncbi:MAG: hypothetical protein JWQ04_2609 [Pedosphaera sp.]|nr:hypothetical protein [Pedosphaera sp.]